MLSKDELNEYYKQSIYPGLISLETERKSIVKFLKNLRYLLLFSLTIIMIFFGEFIFPKYFPLPQVGLVLISLISYFIVSALKKRHYKKVFKPKVVAPLLEAIGEDVLYEPKRSLAREDVEKAAIFDDYGSLNYTGLKNSHTSFDHCKGDDYVKGLFDGVALEFSELLITRKIDTDEFSEDNRRRTETMFRGFFFISELQTETKEGFCMVAKYDSEPSGGLLGGIIKVGAMIGGLMGNERETIECGEERLDKHFKFYGEKSDMISIFKDPVVKSLLHLWNKEFLVRISLRGNKIYIGLDLPGHQFLEAKLSQSLEDYEEPMQLVTYIKKVVALVKSFEAKDEDIEMQW